VNEFVVQGGYVLTMDPALGDLPGGGVHVRDGEIVAVGPAPDPDCPRIDATGTVVMLGLVDTHWHLWTTLFRSMSSSSPQTAYFALNVANGLRCRPEDLYHGVRLGLVDAVNTGITTVHDWAHNLRSPEYADAIMAAHREIGLRGRFSYGTGQGHPADRTADLADLARVAAEWFDGSRLPLMHLRIIERLAAESMLGPHTQLIHALYTTAGERAAIRDSGASVSLSPWSELLIGYGLPPVKQLLDSSVLVTLSVDTLSLTGTADLWSAIRLATGLLRAGAEQELAVGTRRMLELSTVDAARSLGLGDVAGSLTPGKRADLILVRVDQVGTAPFTDPTNTLALAAGAANVDTVIVDGRVLKRAGRLTTVDPAEVVAATDTALRSLLALS
jgi:5-methylthioadenosine/S-adenosylhomocysteine deaminase